MKTTDTPQPAAPDESRFPSIDLAALDDVTGGCGACGQTCANGPAPSAPNTPSLAAAFSAFSRRSTSV